MDAELLRKACEAAELDCWYSATHGQRVGVLDENGREVWSLSSNHVTLPAYVTSLLVAKVRETEGIRNRFWRTMSRTIKTPATSWGWLQATDEQRMRAALEALEGE